MQIWFGHYRNYSSLDLANKYIYDNKKYYYCPKCIINAYANLATPAPLADKPQVEPTKKPRKKKESTNNAGKD